MVDHGPVLKLGQIIPMLLASVLSYPYKIQREYFLHDWSSLGYGVMCLTKKVFSGHIDGVLSHMV